MNRKNTGLSMVIGVLFMFIIILAVTASQFKALQDYNSTAEAASRIEEDRLQEKLYIIGLTNRTAGESVYIENVTVKNSGSITILLKSLYIDHLFLFDPSNTSINPAGGQINPNSTLNIMFTGLDSPQPYEPESILTVGTERGTRSMVYEKTLTSGEERIVTVESNFGPLRLEYKAFWHAKYLNNTIGPWMSGWEISTKEGEVMWKINVTNIDTKAVTIRNTSCFVLTSIESPAVVKSWYINITTPLPIPPGQNATLIFSWTSPGGANVNSPPGTACQCKVFLAFFGVYPDSNVAYAQTIPFQSVEVVK